jgi:nucleotide-binding universal stress UspA family protein
MQFKDILVHIDDSPQCASRLELAVRLASEQGAHLTGLYVVIHPPYSGRGEGMRLAEARAQEMFERLTRPAGNAATWLAADWGTIGVTMAQVVNYYANTKDLVIVGQNDPATQPWDVPADLPQQVVIGAGRPVLVVPYTGNFTSVGNRAVVAWKGGRVSARAVNDALPFLLNAEQVHVVTINDAVERGNEEGNQGESRISVNLQRHGIPVSEDRIVMQSIPVANLLMTYAWEHSCDLIVMGVHVNESRTRQDLGPVATDFLNNMTLPVLMSH